MLAEWIGRIVVAGGMGLSGVLLIILGRYAAEDLFDRKDLAGIRTANTLASEEAWTAAHIRASRPAKVAGVVTILAGAWLLLPVSFSTALTGLVSITMVAAAIVGYCFLVGDLAAAKVLSKSEMRDCDDKQP